MADLITGLADTDIATDWRHERASMVDDDGTDDADGTDGTDSDGTDSDGDSSDSDADQTDS
ncbi:MAG TPA: hypothetical protein VFH36_11430 [Acidimicrobiales bacterium]|jgi:hypothetical protein|nr:hypothetical protein [Acidimicrobiales bacterium]